MSRSKRELTGIGPVLRRAVLLMFFLTAGQAAAQSGFTDVDPDAWSARYIAAIRDAGITLGCGDGKYCPEASVTREQMAAFLIRAVAGEPPPDYCAGQAPFADVSPAGWACGYIKWLGELGVTAGCGGANYCPGAVVTREQMAAFVVRALEGEPAADACAAAAPFSDVAPESWSCGYIRRLAELGITSGCGNGRYCPAAPVRRDEMAAFLARAFLGVRDTNAWNKALGLLELSSAEPGTFTASWLPVGDPATPESHITYELHLSASADFLPDPGTRLDAVSGGAGSGAYGMSLHAPNLNPGTPYYVRVRALGPQGRQTTSNALVVQLPALAPVRTATQLTEWRSGDFALLGPERLQPAAGVPVPNVGELILHNGTDAFLKRVVALGTSGGRPFVETVPAGLNEVFTQVQLSSDIKIAPVPAIGLTGVAADALALQSTPAGTRLTWPETGFTLLGPRQESAAPARAPGVAAPVGQAAPATQGGQAGLSETTDRRTRTGTYARVVGPAAVALVPGPGGTVQITMKIDKDDKSFWTGEDIPLAICGVENLDVRPPSGKRGEGLAVLGSLNPTRTERFGDYTAFRAATQLLHLTATSAQVDPGSYEVKFTVRIGKAEDACKKGAFGWSDSITFTLPVYVASEPNFPSNEVAKVSFSGGFTVNNDVTFSFDPVLESEVVVKNLLLESARLVSRTDARLEQRLTITASGAADLDATHPLIPERRFIKVYMAGPVPIVMTGSFATDLRVQGHTTGKITAQESLEFGFERLEYGFAYDDGEWTEIKNVEPFYHLKLSGEADAEAHLTISLLPRLQVTFYEALTGRLLVEPYVTAEAGIHGRVYADFVPEGMTAEADYWLTKGALSGGLNAWLYASLNGCKLDICQWPRGADRDDYETYQPLTLIPETPILGLPALGAQRQDSPAHPADSRAIRFRGAATDVPNPLRNLFGVGPAAFITFAQWTRPKVIARDDLIYRVLDPAPADAPGEHWIAFETPGTYEVRLGGHSSLGGWARQVAALDLDLRDDDRDGMLDWWEAAYGIDDPNEDANGSGRSNLEEFRAGACPTCPPISLSASVLGRGRVLGAGIDCPGTCTAHFNQSVSLLLTAEPDLGSAFEGWGDACAARGNAPTCEVVVDGSTRVSARFSGAGDGELPWMPLNDTGIVGCADASRNNLPCPVSGYPGQDAQYGRDVTHNNDSDGHAGFSFTKLDANGNALSASATSWSCVRDNVTGLVWEVKTDDAGLRDKDWTYSWYNPDSATNGGWTGLASRGNCFDAARCDTHKYVADVNSQGLCGARDWRLPSVVELLSIISNDRNNPSIDAMFFPNARAVSFWSSSAAAYDLAAAWSVSFNSYRSGYVNSYGKGGPAPVRLVRDAQ